MPLVDGKHEVGGWTLHCDGWQNTSSDFPIFRSGATKDNPFPECRRGSLDGGLLARLGLDEARMLENDGAPDTLFFQWLLLPVCEQSGIENNPRQFFCAQVAQWCNLCAIGELDLGCGAGHNRKNTVRILKSLFTGMEHS